MKQRAIWKWAIALVIGAVLTVGCGNQPVKMLGEAGAAVPDAPSDPGPTLENEVNAVGSSVPSMYGLTYQQANGNRLAVGLGSLPVSEPVRVPLDGIPAWVVGAESDRSLIVVAVLDDGRVQGFVIEEGVPVPLQLAPDRITAGSPPLLLLDQDGPEVWAAPFPEGSPSSHPVLSLDGETIFYVAAGGDLIAYREAIIDRLPIEVLPDARIVFSAECELGALYSDATLSYPHGVLGDEIEGGGLSIIRGSPPLERTLLISPPAGAVFEGLSPMLVDFDRDGCVDILTTVSDAVGGARLVLYNLEGDQMAASAAIGRGSRWRHQIAVAPFGPDGEMELAAVLTPHIGGVVEFFRLKGDELQLVASQPGFTSHVIGSRNLDMAAAGDFDGDGRIELLLPDQDMINLGAVQRVDAGAEVDWSFPLGGRLSTNLAAVSMAGGGLALAAGTDAGVLLIWVPR